MNKSQLKQLIREEIKALDEIGMFHDPIGYEKSKPKPSVFTKKYVNKDAYDILKNGKKLLTFFGSEGEANAYINKRNRELIKTRQESVNELKLNDLVGNQYKYVIGSGEEKYLSTNDKKYVIEMIEKSLEHYLYDHDFALNYLDGSQRKQYESFFEKEVLKPMLSKIDFTLNNFFTLDKDKVKWALSSNDTRKMVDEIFRKNKKIPVDIKREYYEYRLDYAGVKLKESINEGMVKIEVRLFKDHNQNRPDKTMPMKIDSKTSLSKLLNHTTFKAIKKKYGYIELHYGGKFLGSTMFVGPQYRNSDMVLGPDNWEFKKGKGLQDTSFIESINERERQLRDPKKEMLVVKDGKVIVIDKEDFDKYKRKGWLTAEGVK